MSMPDYQYYFVALSQNPVQYQFIGGLSSVVWPSEIKLDEERISPFRVVQIAQADAQNNLPTRLTTWTSTSHLLWNDCAASALVQKQQESLVDWLHFGGQLIVNGPESQAALNASFLSDYLPIKNLKAGRFDKKRWQAFSHFWTIARQDEMKGQEINLPIDREPPLIDGELAAGARWVNACEGLVAERFVGSGRVVMTTFPLGESMMVRWPSYSSFFNAALMHRPPRVWRTSPDKSHDMTFVGPQYGLERNPTYVSRVRLLGRDLGTPIPAWKHPGRILEETLRTSPASSSTNSIAPFPTLLPESAQEATHQGVAQIESDAAFPLLATAALKSASGIQVPRIKTIIQLLAGYFVVLVPLNWVVFRAIGRVEFAWLAAPCIAVIGAVVVARSVQLDIGFSRSQTTLNLFELKSGYHRGHLSSFLSLYTSLSTQYRARYASNEGIVLPVSSFSQQLQSTQFGDVDLRYSYADDEGAGLNAFPVRSNSISFLRGEEIEEIEGNISMAWDKTEPLGIRVQNATNISLKDVGMIAKTKDGQFCKAWIGNLETQANNLVRTAAFNGFARISTMDEADNAFVFDDWKVIKRLGSELGMGTRLAEIAVRHPFGLGEVMLMGWTDIPLTHLEIEPKASQRAEVTLIVVRLEGVDVSELGPDLDLPSQQVDRDTLPPFDPEIP